MQTLLDATAPIVAAASDPTLSADAVTAIALHSQLEGDIAEIDADLASWTVDPVEGPQILIFNIELFQSVETVADGRAMVERWRAMGPYVDQHVANLRAEAESGRVAVHTPVANVIEAMDGVLAQPDEAWALLNPARAEHPAWPPADPRGSARTSAALSPM